MSKKHKNKKQKIIRHGFYGYWNLDTKEWVHIGKDSLKNKGGE